MSSENLLFCVATFTNYLKNSRWLAIAYISGLAASPCTFMLWRGLISLNLMNQPRYIQTFFLQLPHLLAFIWLKRGPCPGIGSGLGNVVVDVNFYPDYKNISISVIRLFCFFVINAFIGVVLSVLFKSFFFAFTTWFFDATENGSFNNWPNFNILVSQGKGEALREEERWEIATWRSRQNTYNICQLNSPSM